MVVSTSGRFPGVLEKRPRGYHASDGLTRPPFPAYKHATGSGPVPKKPATTYSIIR